jgi:hypothetical protein
MPKAAANIGAVPSLKSSATVFGRRLLLARFGGSDLSNCSHAEVILH